MGDNYVRLRGSFGATRMPARPFGFEKEQFHASACGREIHLRHSDGAMATRGPIDLKRMVLR